MEEPTLKPWQQIMSSGAGAMLVATFMTPLDVVKTRLQAQDRFHSKKCFLYSNGLMDHVYLKINGDPPSVALHTPEEICNCKWYNRPKYFNGTLDAIFKISRIEGFRSLWSGLSPTLALALPTTVVYLTSYEHLKEVILKAEVETVSPTAASMVSGTISRIFACTAVAPLDLIRTKMQSKKMAFYDVVKAVRITVGHEGYSALWKGYTATIMRDVPFSAIYWPLYEMLRPSQFHFEKNFAAGATAGTIASMITLPFDNIKTRKQLELGESMIIGANGKGVHTNMDVAIEIYRTNGFKGFFAGLTPRILKIAPACAIMISSYEYCKKFFREWNKQ